MTAKHSIIITIQYHEGHSRIMAFLENMMPVLLWANYHRFGERFSLFFFTNISPEVASVSNTLKELSQL